MVERVLSSVFFQIQFDYPGWVKWIFAHVPFTMRIYRAFLMIKVGHCIYVALFLLIGKPRRTTSITVFLLELILDANASPEK
jgi:hypothetical protein